LFLLLILLLLFLLLLLLLHHVAIVELGPFLTCSGLTYPQVFSRVFLNSFCLLV
jgi:hypothetical protein